MVNDVVVHGLFSDDPGRRFFCMCGRRCLNQEEFERHIKVIEDQAVATYPWHA